MSLLHPFRDHHRRELAKQPFPGAWAKIIDRNVGCCRCLHPDERKRLEELRLQDEVETGTPSMISDYGATKPAEFFAVVTELFFEKPVELRQQHPELYEEFRQYYHQDPAERAEECR